MLKEYIENFVKIFNYVDFLVITDKYGYIEYYKAFRSLGRMSIEDPVGLHILEIHRHLDNQSSTIMRVLKNKEPIFYEKQELQIFKDKTVNVLSTTLPIMEGNEIIGALDINKYYDSTEELIENSRDKDYPFVLDNIITNDKKMIELKERIYKVAKTDSPVMIYGETGTGKELISQCIHNHSDRRLNPLIVQNCSAIPLSLGESIFFGTVKGSFTGAENKMGLFEMAQGSSLVLDEINSMDINLQSKILRAIENNKIRKVGGTNVINTDVRIISTLNEEPNLVLEQNKIRQDLFYRIGVVLIRIPPLRERKIDIRLLVDNFIKYYNIKMGKNVKDISKNVMDLFMEYSWPGNVRELMHVIESAFNFVGGDIIQEKELPYYLLNYNNRENNNEIEYEKFSLAEAVKNYECKYIENALQNSENLSKAAKLLQISRQSLKYKIDTYGISL